MTRSLRGGEAGGAARPTVRTMSALGLMMGRQEASAGGLCCSGDVASRVGRRSGWASLWMRVAPRDPRSNLEACHNGRRGGRRGQSRFGPGWGRDECHVRASSIDIDVRVRKEIRFGQCSRHPYVQTPYLGGQGAEGARRRSGCGGGAAARWAATTAANDPCTPPPELRPATMPPSASPGHHHPSRQLVQYYWQQPLPVPGWQGRRGSIG